jgi:hypothetical protein
VKVRYTDYYRTDAGPNIDFLIGRCVAAFEAYQFELQRDC